jgi:hypothetical protein
MKRIFTFSLITFSFINGWSQNSIGINTENPLALLDIQSSDNQNAGIILPNVGKFPSTSPNVDQNGMLLFLDKEISNSAGFEGFYFWDHENDSWQYIFQSKMINQNLFKTMASAHVGFDPIPGINANTNIWFPTEFTSIEAPDANFYLEDGEVVIGRTGMYAVYFTGAVSKGQGSTTATQTEVGIFINGVLAPNLISTIPLPSADNGDRSGNHTISAIIHLTKDQVVTVQTRRIANIDTEMKSVSPYTLTLTYLD